MKKINWKMLNISFWIEILLAYVLPFVVVDDFQYNVGFPISFITAYSNNLGVNPLMSMHFNPLAFFVDGVLIYFALILVLKLYNKIKGKSDK